MFCLIEHDHIFECLSTYCVYREIKRERERQMETDTVPQLFWGPKHRGELPHGRVKLSKLVTTSSSLCICLGGAVESAYDSGP